MTTALNPAIHSITLKDDNDDDGSTTTYHYHLRSLRQNKNSHSSGCEKNDGDIQRWTKFCASVFAYKPSPPPPEYFSRHFYNDPRCDASLVRVLIFCPNYAGRNANRSDVGEDEMMNGEIVSSVRIFLRKLSTGSSSSGAAIEAGGIGEVCTSPNHQRRGLSKILLKDAINIMSTMNESGGMSCSLLHANPEFRPVYNKVGAYESVPSKWSLVPMELKKLTISTTDKSNKWMTRQAIFPQDASQLQALHAEYSEKRLITIMRSTEYWKNYVSAELGNSLWVLEDNTSIVAWLSIRERGDRYQLREFGVDRNITSITNITAFALRRLLSVALQQIGEDINADSDKKISLLLPTIILSDMEQDKMIGLTNECRGNWEDDYSFFDPISVVEENDDGWMYVMFDRSEPNVLELTMREKNPVQHLIWPTDSF